MRLVAFVTLFLSLRVLAQDEPSMPELKGEAKARLQNLDQYLEDWDIEAAKQELAALEKIAPADLEPVSYYRGRIAFEEGRYVDAVALLEKAGVADKPGSWVRLAKETRDIVTPMLTQESEHFIVHYPKGRDEVLVPWTLDTLEAARTALEKDLGYAPPGKIRVEIVGSAGELSKVSTLSKEAIRTTGTIAICKFNKLMVTTPRSVLQGYDWRDTLAHEFVHLVVSKKSNNSVPIWMHEGLAKYLESRWRGPAGGAMTPSSLALLGKRVRSNELVPFEKMHPSMALLPTAEDAATAFSEVFFAIKLIDTEGGPRSLERMLDAMSKGTSEKLAVEQVMKKKWPEFERSWMAYLKKQPFPKDLIPPTSHERKQLTDGKQEQKNKGREVSFGDFKEVKEVDARRDAHLGELFRERNHMASAAEVYGRAYKVVGDKYESVSNKYALTLLELKKYDEAATVLEKSLVMHPGSVSTNVHLGRIYMRGKKWNEAKGAYLEALNVNPFDPEVMMGLLASADALKDAELRKRAMDGAKLVLDEKDETAILKVAKNFAQTEDLASVDFDGRDGG
ncbi:MAG: tetratricopeptide repeat protein [Archangium sp.]